MNNLKIIVLDRINEINLEKDNNKKKKLNEN